MLMKIIVITIRLYVVSTEKPTCSTASFQWIYVDLPFFNFQWIYDIVFFRSEKRSAQTFAQIFST